MTPPATPAALAAARRVADAVLYEGYVLFPYRQSAQKNRYRWQFGVVAPEAHVAAGGTEADEVSSQCLLRAGEAASIEVAARFLHVRRRQVEQRVRDGFVPVEALDLGEELFTTWDEGVEREVTSGRLDVAALLASGHEVAFSLPAGSETQDVTDAAGVVRGRLVRDLSPVAGVLRVTAERLDGDVVRLTSVVRNHTDWAVPAAPRDEVVRRSLVGVHLLLSAGDATFASLLDPPAWAERWAGSVRNRNTYPVLAGEPGRHDLMLSTPIVLPDHPSVAPESAGDAFDATEIDELLTLSVRSLTDAEKRQARATDSRAAEVIDRAETLPPAVLERLHGAVRQFGPSPQPPATEDGDRHSALDREMAAFLGVDEAPRERIVIDGREVAVGDPVRLRPSRRADAQDLFVAGRVARVERIERDLEGASYLAVTLEEDPGADLHHWSRRFLYFHPEEVEPVGPDRAAGE